VRTQWVSAESSAGSACFRGSSPPRQGYLVQSFRRRMATYHMWVCQVNGSAAFLVVTFR